MRTTGRLAGKETSNNRRALHEMAVAPAGCTGGDAFPPWTLSWACRLATVLWLAGLLPVAQTLGGVTLVQSLTLRPSWNAVWLEVSLAIPPSAPSLRTCRSRACGHHGHADPAPAGVAAFDGLSIPTIQGEGSGLAPRLVGPQVDEDGIHFQLQGLPGRVYDLEVPSDLLHWTPVRTLTADAAGLLAAREDVGASGRFYRARTR